MSKISKVLRSIEKDQLAFFCPGCMEMHSVRVAPYTSPSGWVWNGDRDKPTFSPSVLVRGMQTERDAAGNWTGEFVLDSSGKPLPKVCHSFVRDGSIEFLSDCTHALAGKTVPLPELPVMQPKA